jgi:malate dehydrogenase
MASRVNRILTQLQPAVGSVQVASNATGDSYKKPLKVLVTGACGNIAYSLIFQLCNGAMLGPNSSFHLCLLDLPGMENGLKGVAMEVNDGAFPLVLTITTTTDYKEAFSNCDVAMLVGAKPRGKGMERKDLLAANGKIFAGQGKALDQYASKDCKVIVVGNPANTNCLIAMKNAPSLNKRNFTAMTRLDQNRAESGLATRLNVPVSAVSNVAIWGNHSATQYPDVNRGLVADFPNVRSTTSVRAAVNDDAWLNGDYMKAVQQRGKAIINARGKSSAASAAKAAVDHIRDWLLGTPEGVISSMGVISDGNPYGIPDDLIYSFPCVCKDGEWSIVGGIPIDDFSRQKMDATAKELLEEKAAALGN